MENKFYETAADVKNYIYMRYSKGGRLISHFHKSFELTFILGGVHNYSVNGFSDKVDGGDIVFAGSFDAHTYISEPDSDRYAIVIGEKYCAPFKSWLGDVRLPYFMKNKIKNTEIISLAEKMGKEFYTLSDFRKQAYVDEILSKLADIYGTVEKTANKTNDAIIAVLTYLEKNYRDNLTLVKTAKEVGYSPNYLSRIFNKYIMNSFSGYLNSLRLKKAFELLNSQEGKNISVTEVALNCGYNSLGSFYRNYKKFFGNSPKRKST